MVRRNASLLVAVLAMAMIVPSAEAAPADFTVVVMDVGPPVLEAIDFNYVTIPNTNAMIVELTVSAPIAVELLEVGSFVPPSTRLVQSFSISLTSRPLRVGPLPDYPLRT